MSGEASASQAANAFRATLDTALASLGVALPDGAVERLTTHYMLLIELNRSLNLTRITAPEEAAVKHYADSLALLAALPAMGVTVKRVLDVGTGAGFPAVPLAVARPDWAITAIDSTGKKTRAAVQLAAPLKLANLDVRQARGEDLASERETFDLVCFRAVGALDECLRTARPCLSPGGAAVCWKAADVSGEELRDAGGEARKLGLAPVQQFHYEIAGLARPRRLQLIWSRRM